ncbi:MAG: class I SAM-dependent methyltransferase [Spirochaetota bacterium]|nr:class I SAM-dependent methyltransferase [Spirochaetota bacterium]
MDLKEEEILKDKVHSHWYYVSKGLALLKIIKKTKINSILDIGAGSGVFSKIILKNTNAREAICFDKGYSKDKEENFFGKKLYYTNKISSFNADLVLFMDVIEHIKDDISFVKTYINKVKPGTYVLFTVPAFQFLFSGHDLFLEHYRRYTLLSLKTCLNSAGLTVLKTRYYFLLLFPFMAIIRIFAKVKMKYFSKNYIAKSDLKIYGKFINKLFILIHRIELLFFPLNKIAGLTAFCLAIKK